MGSCEKYKDSSVLFQNIFIQTLTCRDFNKKLRSEIILSLKQGVVGYSQSCTPFYVKRHYIYEQKPHVC